MIYYQKKIGLLVLFFLVYQKQLLSQITNEKNYLENGISFFNENKYKRAVEAFEEGRDYYTKIADFENSARTLKWLAKCRHMLGDLETEQKLLKEGIFYLKDKRIDNAGLHAEIVLDYGNFFYNKSDFKNALLKYNEALSILDTSGIAYDFTKGKIHLKKALTLAVKSKFDQAVQQLDMVKQICDKNPEKYIDLLIEYYSLYARLNSSIGKNSEAVLLLEKARKLLLNEKAGKKLQLVEIELIIGMIAYNARNYEKALKYYSKALPEYALLMGKDHIKMSMHYNNLSRIYSRIGEYHKALKYNEKGLKIVKEKRGENHRGLGVTYSSMAAAYDRMGDYDNALKYYYLAIENIKYNHGSISRELIYLFSNVGRILGIRKKYDDAIRYFKKSLQVGKDIYGENDLNLAFTYQHLGEVLTANRQYNAGRENFELALEIRKLNLDQNNWEVALSYLALADYYYKIKNFEDAGFYYYKVLEIYKEDLNQVLKQTYNPLPFNDLKNIFNTSLGIAGIYKEKFKKEGNKKDLQQAANEYEKAGKILLKMRMKITSDDDRIALGKTNQKFFSEAIATYYQLYEITCEFIHLQKMLYYSEQSRARTLTENILPKANFQTQGLGNMLKHKNYLTEKRSEVLGRLSITKHQQKKDSTLDTITKELFNINWKYDSLLYEIQKKNPAYFAVNIEKAPLDISGLQKLMKQNAIVEFFQFSDHEIAAFLITEDKVKVDMIKMTYLSATVNSFKKSIQEKNTLVYKELASKLYNKLLRNLLKGLPVTELIIIPDGKLWEIDFDLLLTKKVNTNNPKEFPYFMRNYAISYANSIRLLSVPKQKNHEITQDCLAFSYSTSDSEELGSFISLAKFRNEKDDLPGTRREIREIANLLNGDYYFGTAANEANFKAKASNFRILHLALHGEVNKVNPEYSRLFFTQNKDSIEDNYLYAHELKNMYLPAEMAVLSACNTGAGKNAVREGIIGLGRAFQYAGTKSLVMSKWEVSDATAPILMKYFYENIKEGMIKSRAMQQAKLKFLNSASGEHVHPYYWSSFFILGDNGALAFKSGYPWYYFLLLIPIIVLAYYALRKRFKV
jgi:CHAT domain-containing protein